MIIECLDCKDKKPKYMGYVCLYCGGKKQRKARLEELDTIATQQLETIADLQAALQAQSKALGDARSFIQQIANSPAIEKESNQALLYRAIIRDAQWQVVQWDTSAVAAITPESTEDKPKVQLLQLRPIACLFREGGGKKVSCVGNLGKRYEVLLNAQQWDKAYEEFMQATVDGAILPMEILERDGLYYLAEDSDS